jgi:cation diffusion facilitator CzcD-associated flavoprotein CzcO
VQRLLPLRHGFEPDFAGVDRFRGQIVRPQHWQEKLDYAGKRIIVIGSGATAITLVPAMTDKAAHVTMLQRSPTYVVSLTANDKIAERLLRVLPRKYRIRDRAMEERSDVAHLLPGVPSMARVQQE